VIESDKIRASLIKSGIGSNWHLRAVSPGNTPQNPASAILTNFVLRGFDELCIFARNGAGLGR
jgi:hypothetical protein